MFAPVDKTNQKRYGINIAHFICFATFSKEMALAESFIEARFIAKGAVYAYLMFPQQYATNRQ